MIAIIRSEPEHVALTQLLEARKRDHVTLLAPACFWLEIVNSLVRRHRVPSEKVLEAFHEIDEFAIQRVDLERPLLVLSLDLSERHGLTAYDASYLAIAITSDADLLTLDGDLASAAGDRAVSIRGFPGLHETPASYEHEVTWPRYKEASAYLSRLREKAMAGR